MASESHLDLPMIQSRFGMQREGHSSSGLSLHTKFVTSVAYSPNGKLIASGSYDQSTRVWDAEMGRNKLAPLFGHNGGVMSVAFSPHGKWIASGSDLMIRRSGSGMLRRDKLLLGHSLGILMSFILWPFHQMGRESCLVLWINRSAYGTQRLAISSLEFHNSKATILMSFLLPILQMADGSPRDAWMASFESLMP
jgi:WD40 repeat protein